MGMTFNNPIGLAAGFDKDCEATKALQRLGFGFIEGGSVTPKPQPGNPKPRVFRLSEDKAVINCYGFPSKGLDAVEKNLKWSWGPMIMPEKTPKKGKTVNGGGSPAAAPGSADAAPPGSISIKITIPRFLTKYILPPVDGVLGLNLGINKTTRNPTNDYCKGVDKLGKFGDYIVINVSSPNTPGLRDLQHKENLARMLRHISGRVQRAHKNSSGTRCKVGTDRIRKYCSLIG